MASGGINRAFAGGKRDGVETNPRRISRGRQGARHENRSRPVMKFSILYSTLMLAFTASAHYAEAEERTKSTYCRAVPERADDFAWENDLAAFRVYGPALRSKPENSGIDCWLKRVEYPIIDKWYARDAKG